MRPQPALAVNPESDDSPAGSPRPFEVSVCFVDDEEIAEMNAQYRAKPRPTDVLSFAQSEGEAFPGAEEFQSTKMLGDIVISIPTAVRQAAERHHSLQTEIEFLAVHGCLHLQGYDHQTSAQRRVMWKRQDEVIAALQAGFK
jgi:probable rRNA maturation factor